MYQPYEHRFCVPHSACTMNFTFDPKSCSVCAASADALLAVEGPGVDHNPHVSMLCRLVVAAHKVALKHGQRIT